MSSAADFMPASHSLKALAEAAEACRGCELYKDVTNAVKHFKWKPRGKRRLHQTPRAGGIEACKPWLEAEVAAVEPAALLAMGATAGRALFGTIHPSAILRLRDHGEREAELAGFVADLEAVGSALRDAAR